MVTKEVLAKFLKLSTERIYAGLDSNKWEGESKEAALSVLKNRGKDISKYLDVSPEPEKPEIKKASSEKVDELFALISEELERNDKEMISAIYSVVGEGENLMELPEETVDSAINLIKDKRKDQEIKEKQKQRKKDSYSSPKCKELTPEKKKIADDILARTDLTKKQKLLEMWNQGLTRTETLSLHFMDPTYIYDLYREVSK